MIARILLCLVLWSGGASAACSIKSGATVALETVGTVILVPVVVNDVRGTFILDTGARMTIVTPDAVDRFGLARDEWTSTTMGGIGGVGRQRNANPRSITLGGIALHRNSLAQDATLRVGPLARTMIGGRRIDGFLGRDFLSVFDLDLDFPRRTLTVFEIRDCTGRFLPWPGDYVSVPVENPAENALWVPVELDGVMLRGLLDSGASTTLVAAPGMFRLSLDINRLSGDPSRIASGLGSHTVTMWQHQFHTMRIGGETFPAPKLLVAPIALNPISDMLLGADWLLPHHVWISYTTHQLFVMK